MKELNFDSCVLEPDEINALVNAIKKNKVLKSLNLQKSNLSSMGIDAITPPLASRLTSLNVSMNQLQKTDAKRIAEVLKENKILKTLDVSKNRFGSQGAIARLERPLWSTRQWGHDAPPAAAT